MPNSADPQTQWLPDDEQTYPTYRDVLEQNGIVPGQDYPAPIIPEGVIPAPGQDMPEGYPLPELPAELEIRQDAPAEPVVEPAPIVIPPPLPDHLPRPQDQQAEVSTADNIIDAADADVYEAEGFADASPFGDIAERAKDAVQKLEREDDDSLPPEVQEGASHISGALHDTAGHLLNVAHQIHDSIIEAAAEDVHEADVDVGGDTDTSADDPDTDGN